MLNPNENGYKVAGEIIRNGGLVAFPTETVYGLGADATNSEAVKSIYIAKGRPSDNPMIVHVSNQNMVKELVKELTPMAQLLMDEFWPGPITFVLPKTDKVPDVTTGGLSTVAIRMPSRDEAANLIESAGVPIAAPSANTSGKPSPTTASDVLEDMNGKIDAIIEGANCDVGIESTVLDLTTDTPTILRPGYITKSMIEKVAKVQVAYDQSLFKKPEQADFHPKAPGMKYKHYAPKANVRIVEGDKEAVLKKIDALKAESEKKGEKVIVLDYAGDGDMASRDFFRDLREGDRAGVDLFLIASYDWDEVGFSVMNRMIKSAGYDKLDV